MTRTRAALGRALEPLHAANYRRFFIGQLISVSGTWMQMVGEMWLVLSLTHSGFALGVATALQFVPILVAAPLGGLLADRFSRRRLLMITQAGMVVPAATLFLVTLTGHSSLWLVYAMIFARGCFNAVDNPTRQSFFFELVGRDRVAGAIALNGVLINGARVFGPGLAGILIATVGVAPCFAVNALSYAAVLVALWRMDPRQLHRQTPVPRAPGQLREGLRYALRTPDIRLPLALMLIVSTLAFNFQLLLPLLATQTFDGGGGTYGALSATMAAGAIVGALVTASRARPTNRLLVGSALAFGVLILLAAAAPSLALELAVLVPLGAANITYASTTNSALQVAVEPAMRGRVMALYAVVFLGSTPLGGPLVGWIAEVAGVRAALALGGAATVLGAVAAQVALRRRAPAPEPVRPALRPAGAPRPATVPSTRGSSPSRPRLPA